jgi:hypothetical protein
LKAPSNFQICFPKFGIYSISNIFLKLYKEDATTTPIASYRLFVIVDKVPMSSIPSKIFKWYTKSTFLAFFLFYLYFHICMSFFLSFWWGWILNGAYQHIKNVNMARAWKDMHWNLFQWSTLGDQNWVFGVINFEIQLLTNFNWFWV